MNRTAYSTDEKSHGFIVDNQLSGFISQGELEHYLLFGVDYRDVKGSSTYDAFTNVADINLFHPNNNLVDPSPICHLLVSRSDDRNEAAWGSTFRIKS
ncbi:hypothetical protein P4S72_20080 [Vibrio sp. PP-XX7]